MKSLQQQDQESGKGTSQSSSRNKDPKGKGGPVRPPLPSIINNIQRTFYFTQSA